MLGQGVHPKVAADMLGHATVAITLDTSSHVTETMQRWAVRGIAALLREGGDAHPKSGLPSRLPAG